MNLKHFFKINENEAIEVYEPIGFVDSTHKIEESDFYGRDVVLGDEDIELTITRSHFIPISGSQILPSGTIVKNLNHAFDYIANELKYKGWECEIEYILFKDDIEFSKGIIDGLTAIISKDEIKFKVIQNTKREEVKRQFETVVNAFSDEDLEGNPIDPCQTIDMLIKAKPILNISEWDSTGVTPVSGSTSDFYFDNIRVRNFSAVNNIYNIKQSNPDTLSYFETQKFVNFSTGVLIGEGFTYLQPVNNLSNVTIEIKDFVATALQTVVLSSSTGVNRQITDGYGSSKLVLKIGFDVANITSEYVLQELEFGFDLDSGLKTFDSEFTLNISQISAGQRIYIYIESECFSTYSGSDFLGFEPPFGYYIVNECVGGNIKITSTSTAIDTVSKVVRFIDLFKHACNSVGAVNSFCTDFDINGKFYNNFATNGYLLGKITDKPFNNTLKDLLNVVYEQNVGYQVNSNGVIEALHYDNFYNDDEIGTFIQIPELRDETELDVDSSVLNFEYSYKKSSQGRETNQEGSIDDVHGKTRWLIPTKKVEKKVKFEFDHIRSAFLLENQRSRFLSNENNTSLSDDTGLFLISGVASSPSRKGGFTLPLTMQVISSPIAGLKIIAPNIRWDILGLAVGSSFQIVEGENVGFYTVYALEPTVITLIGGGAISFNGIAICTVEYTLSGVSFINETFEPFSIIEGIESSYNYSNLRYSIKRNLTQFYSLIGSWVRYLSNKQIQNTLFDINGNLVTQLITENESVIDSASIDIETIKEMRKVEPRIETVNVFADFETATDFFNKVETDKGYVRVQKYDGTVILGYPKQAEYKWADNSLELKLRPKKEDEYYDIDINYVNSFKVIDIFVSLYDEYDILLTTARPFNKMRLNGVIYDDVIEFEEALITAIE